MNRNLKRAAQLLKKGKVIAFPTETVFGIGACLNRPEAIKQIFKIKNRPKDKPLQVLIANMEQAQKLGKLSKKAFEYAKKRWPGPFTFVVPKTGKVSKLVTGGSSKVGLRMPDHQTILELIKECGPIVATSANISGKPPALTTKQAREYVGEKVDYVFPGRTKHGQASKVIDLSKGIKVLRA